MVSKFRGAEVTVESLLKRLAGTVKKDLGWWRDLQEGDGGETYRGQKVTGGRETYRRNLQGVKRLVGLETYMRNIQEWRHIQGGETYRRGERFTEW